MRRISSLFPSSGTGVVEPNVRKIIRLLRQGCTNRPFYHIVVTDRRKDKYDPVIEQLGTYDPLPNEHNEQLVALNYERIGFWIGNGADLTKSMRELLGLSGYFPIYPQSYIQAWRSRRRSNEQQQQTENGS